MYLQSLHTVPKSWRGSKTLGGGLKPNKSGFTVGSFLNNLPFKQKVEDFSPQPLHVFRSAWLDNVFSDTEANRRARKGTEMRFLRRTLKITWI